MELNLDIRTMAAVAMLALRLPQSIEQKGRSNMGACEIKIEPDENGFELHVWVDEVPSMSDGGRLVINIQDVAEDLYDQVKAVIGPWLYERDAARASIPETRNFEFSDSGYELSDPKHPTYHERMADLWDGREK